MAWKSDIIVLSKRVDLGDEDDRNADAAMEIFQKVCRIVHRLGGKFMTVHLGLGRKSPEGLSWERTISSLSELVSYAKGLEVRLCLENLASGWSSRPQLFEKLIRKTGAGITLDIGHARVCQSVQCRMYELEDFVIPHPDRVFNAHIYHEEVDDRHVPPECLNDIRTRLDLLLRFPATGGSSNFARMPPFSRRSKRSGNTWTTAAIQNSFRGVHLECDRKPERTMDEWKTKPSDRFILKWIKVEISARITPRLIHLQRLRPWMITLCSTTVGVFAGVVFALGSGFLAGLLAACAQVLDGVDGQFSRLTCMQSRGGAFLDSVLDRYFDAALVIGLTIYLIRLPGDLPVPFVLVMAFFAVSGSSLISYTTARAESLGIPLGKPTLASKGTRTSVIVLCGWASLFWPPAPILALAYLVVHPNIVVFRRLFIAHRYSDPL